MKSETSDPTSNTPSGQQNNHQNRPNEKFIEGTININSKNTGFVRVNGSKTDDIEIPSDYLNCALHGDTVRILITSRKAEQQATGEVIEVLKRSKAGFAGVLEREKGIYFLVPNDTRMRSDIVIPEDKLAGAKEGQLVFAVITDWMDSKKPPTGEISKILGKPHENDAEMQGIALEKGFDQDFPEIALKEAQEIARNSPADMQNEIKSGKRKDFRGTSTFTIDPADAKDFDDALSFKKLSDDTYEVGVHIADVSHYVKEGTALDAETARRATSVYLVDRTIPMLPEELSNDLCSLKPDVDRLAFSAVFELNNQGHVLKEWFGRTIIHSDKRFTYEDAQNILDEKQGLYHDELSTLNSIAKNLTAAREKAGAISLDTPEVKFRLDETGKPIGVYVKERGDTNRMIEEFMLLANRKVAEFIGAPRHGNSSNSEDKIQSNAPGNTHGNIPVFMYRVHDKPDPDRIENLIFFLKKLGYTVKTKDNIIPPEEINRLLDELKDKEEKDAIHTAIVRSMAKAVYSTKNIGHFGLAFKYYTHFTSPIRRYPDIIVHRLLAAYLGASAPKRLDIKIYDAIAAFSSQREKEAAEAERASIKYKQVEYMMDHVGEIFDGVISGVTEWGVFVEEIETHCEGLVRMRDLGNDIFVYNEKEMSISGRNTKKTYRFGDKVKIKVVKADLDKKTIDYAFA